MQVSIWKASMLLEDVFFAFLCLIHKNLGDIRKFDDRICVKYNQL